MIKEYEFIIDGKVPSLNEYINKMNAHRLTANTFKHNVEQDIKFQLYKQVREQGIQGDFPLKNTADFEFTYVETKKNRDKDNIASSKKFIMDALVAVGIIKNDGWRWVGSFKEDFIIGSRNQVIMKIKVEVGNHEEKEKEDE